MDSLFMSSRYYNLIKDTIAAELNRVHSLYTSRHPDFKGRLSLTLTLTLTFNFNLNQPHLL
eukprot:Pgem_evm1s10857